MQSKRLDTGEFEADFAALDRWLTSRGFTQRDRFRQYKANIEEMGRRGLAGDPAKLHAEVESEGRMTEILSSYVDSIEFVATFTTLIAKHIEIPNAVLRKVLGGHADASRATLIKYLPFLCEIG